MLRSARYYAEGKGFPIAVAGNGWTEGEPAAPLGYTAGLFRVAIATFRHIRVVLRRLGYPHRLTQAVAPCGFIDDWVLACPVTAVRWSLVVFLWCMRKAGSC